ncbi:piggyBac transposable element-derived protein 4-like [Carassius carassius]|uniref:piggyBac transposable element-derived protein 4-like n=1 Tax=Carassius carassius TaxID=217509 RepID=UPI0028692966|nr:piggyBac transposable element-derived protein 4-like [Carassius carassius]XP_059402819.1 piggyBac transposable element-derived protein 4-like [Carassius carassius]XP_059402823.1 piggyBac transposable element-derived protein 4-like [Carassius carassius]XP_059402824.1 piggyBac transposable element-derived protein 4-like [Carassius carassius]
MAHEEALQTTTDSEEESTFSSEEEKDFDDELLHFEDHFDAAEKTISKEKTPSCAHHTRATHKRLSAFNSVEKLNKCERDSDQIPAAKRARTLSWKAETDVDQVPQTLRFLPAREPGPQLSADDSHSPMSLFKLFFTESAVENLCHNTNAQAARAMAKGCKYKWTDVSVDELYRYIGLIFYMSVVKMSSIADYWRQDSLFSVPFPATVMSRDRYRTISWNVHMSHPDADEENDRKRGTDQHDRLFRIKPLMDTVRLACKAFYHPRRNVAVKERLVACRAKTGMRRCTKVKPTKLGFKFFDLSDSSNGYIVDFSIYTGKNCFPADHGLSYDAVMSLLDHKVLGSGYHVYMDDFYTSPKLFTDLFALKFGACGAYREQRKGFLKTAANSLSSDSTMGSIRWIRDGPLVCVKWMDTQVVSVCSTIHAASTGGNVKRNIKAQDTWKTKSVPCPAPVTAYSQHMGGVDLSDQLLQYYAAQHKTMKWYRKVFLHFLDIAANNAFILHKELHGNMTRKEFMEELIAELCDMSQKAAPKQSSTEHVPIPGAELTSDDRRNATVGRRICVHCKAVHGKRLQTPWKCQACDVHLCLQLNRNCFLEWHKSL